MTGTQDDPWQLTTAPGSSAYTMYRDESHPVGGWYGLRTGCRGRFGMYLPPLLEALSLAELTPATTGSAPSRRPEEPLRAPGSHPASRPSVRARRRQGAP